mmetsp:Transcript_35088/g.91018  ORF Transcript_35088/g.91018 Transcript_35088/m.91018 type:complete len:298 (-) Transcript_35088:497-1390(-)
MPSCLKQWVKEVFSSPVRKARPYEISRKLISPFIACLSKNNIFSRKLELSISIRNSSVSVAFIKLNHFFFFFLCFSIFWFRLLRLQPRHNIGQSDESLFTLNVRRCDRLQRRQSFSCEHCQIVNNYVSISQQLLNLLSLVIVRQCYILIIHKAWHFFTGSNSSKNFVFRHFNVLVTISLCWGFHKFQNLFANYLTHVRVQVIDEELRALFHSSCSLLQLQGLRQNLWNSKVFVLHNSLTQTTSSCFHEIIAVRFYYTRHVLGFTFLGGLLFSFLMMQYTKASLRPNFGVRSSQFASP